MKNSINILIVTLVLGVFISSCSSEEDPIQPSPAFKGGTLEPNVGGPGQPNQVYIDLSRNSSNQILRSSWDLGFYCGAEHRVILNSSTGMLAYGLNKFDLTLVNTADTLGLGAQLSLDAIFGALFGPPVPWISEAPTWIDEPSRDLEKTAIDAIDADPSKNRVYIVNRGKDENEMERGWMKIQIQQKGDGYELSYAEISSSTSNTVQISKNSNFNFIFFGFETGEVSVEPRILDWDLAFTTWTELTSFGSGPVPYFFKDYVIINQGGVKVAEVAVVDGSKILEEFNGFSRADLAGLSFSEEVNFIGGNWRTIATPTPGSVTAVKTDRFYIITDSQNNNYKVLFTGMLNSDGERGHPQILYDLL